MYSDSESAVYYLSIISYDQCLKTELTMCMQPYCCSVFIFITPFAISQQVVGENIVFRCHRNCPYPTVKTHCDLNTTQTTKLAERPLHGNRPRVIILKSHLQENITQYYYFAVGDKQSTIVGYNKVPLQVASSGVMISFHENCLILGELRYYTSPLQQCNAGVVVRLR